MLSTIYGGWSSLIMLWWWCLPVAVFWRMRHSRRLWEDEDKTEKTLWRCSSTRCHMIDTFVAVMQFMTTATSGIHCNKLKINVWQICGSVQYLLSFWLSQRLTRFWFYATFSTLGYVRKVCLRYWSFVGSWRGNLLTIYTLVRGRKGGWVLDRIH